MSNMNINNNLSKTKNSITQINTPCGGCTMCACDICDYIRKHGPKVPTGVAGAIIVPYEYIYSNNLLYQGRDDEFVILLGKERTPDSRYFEEFNLPAGRLEKKDNGCYVAGFKRELFEEFKIDVRQDDTFNHHFKEASSGTIRVLFFYGTPIFIGIFPGLSRGPLNDLIRKDNNDPRLGFCHKEMSEVNYFRIQTAKYEHMDGVAEVISSFATGVIDEIKRSGILDNVLD